MEKKPITMVCKDAKEAAKRLNEFVEKGGYKFDVGVMDEYVTTVTRHSDGSTSKTKEKHFRFTGFVETYTGEELQPLLDVRKDIEATKKTREELDRKLNLVNKPAFGPLSIFLLVVAIITLILGTLTLAKVLPLPEEQLPISIVLVVVGVLALAGSILAFVLRSKKKNLLLQDKDKIEQEDKTLKAHEYELEMRIPSWYKNALWKAEGDTVKNASTSFELKK